MARNRPAWRWQLSPGVIAVLYAAVAIVWIATSDRMVNVVGDARWRLVLATSKGIVFVLVTGLMLYWLTRRLVAETRQALKSLAANEAEYRRVIEAANEAVCRVNRAGDIQYANARLAKLLHGEVAQLVDVPFLEFVSEPDRAAFLEQLQRWQKGVAEPRDFRLCDAHGEALFTIVSGTPVFDANGDYCGGVLMVLDITERCRMEEQLREAQKMEAVGRLAGGIAHDFNNILGIIVNSGTVLQEQLRGVDVDLHPLAQILQASDRAAKLVRQLLGFSRKQARHVSVVDLNATVREFSSLLPLAVGEAVQIKLSLDATPATVRVDRSQLEQVLMNLAVNARDAMPSGGTLRIETGRIAGRALTEREGVPDGTYSYIRVSDNGVGISEAVQARIFEPFFTTKPLGQGTGLGLAMVYGIVRQNGGYITVQSQPQQGTCFSIYLPFIDEPPTEEPVAVDALPASGGATILLVEDEADLRRITTHILTAHGYRVIEAQDGLEGLTIGRQRLREIDLLITDLAMPNMGGRELVQRLREIEPELKVIYASGYADEAVENEAHGSLMVGKPVSPDELLRSIRQLLGKDSLRTAN